MYFSSPPGKDKLGTQTSHFSSPSIDLVEGAVTSQAGFLNLQKMKIMFIFHINIDKMQYASLFLLSLIWFILYNSQYCSLSSLACDVTACVREGKQYSGTEK